ncbi:hypothetical protein EW145_g7378 [Phellinidium pouzarii]|uniref:Uncharacterized protein n=1 Tax=Phellinidium pouzarii TaxID=167371 RepID=A0A4S4KJX8_9AGAM|nr:hypothetical protein EW145_g7378 [Phellinidium pouzarii]
MPPISAQLLINAAGLTQPDDTSRAELEQYSEGNEDVIESINAQRTKHVLGIVMALSREDQETVYCELAARHLPKLIKAFRESDVPNSAAMSLINMVTTTPYFVRFVRTSAAEGLHILQARRMAHKTLIDSDDDMQNAYAEISIRGVARRLFYGYEHGARSSGVDGGQMMLLLPMMKMQLEKGVEECMSSDYSEEALTDENLERAFREIEEASEQRALEEEGNSHPGPLHPLVSSLSNSLTNIITDKKRRRGSISISRVGNYPDMVSAVQAELQSTPNGAASPMYTVQTHTISTSSLTSTSSISSAPARHDAEENLTTQKETIVARRNTLTKAVSSAFAKTLTRMRSRGALDELAARDEALIIGIAVHEATTEIQLNSSGKEGTVNADADEVRPPKSTENVVIDANASISAEVKAVAASSTHKVETAPRSRSGSIIRLRSMRTPKVGLRSDKSIERTNSSLNSSSKQSEDSNVHMNSSSTSSGDVIPDGAKSPTTKPHRFAHFARTIVQRLRRRPSGGPPSVPSETQKDIGGRRAPPPPAISVVSSAPSIRLESQDVKSPATLAAGVPLPPSPYAADAKFPVVAVIPTSIPLPPSPATPTMSLAELEGDAGEKEERNGERMSILSRRSTVPPSPSLSPEASLVPEEPESSPLVLPEFGGGASTEEYISCTPAAEQEPDQIWQVDVEPAPKEVPHQILPLDLSCQLL